MNQGMPQPESTNRPDKGASSSSQPLMQLILQASKVTTQVLAAVDAAQAGQVAEAQALLEQAQATSVQAHNAQTQLIQAELQGQGPGISLLAVHAQDHFMNSHLLIQVADRLIQQSQTLQDLTQRIEKLEQK